MPSRRGTCICLLSPRELIRFCNNIIVIFKERQDIFYSTAHVVKMMGIVRPRDISSNCVSISFRKLAAWAAEHRYPQYDCRTTKGCVDALQSRLPVEA
jgi:hypothetical protein